MVDAPLSLIRVIDTETTGMTVDDQVVEVGWTDVRLFSDGWHVESGPSSELFSHTVEMQPEARAAHHLTDEELEGRPLFTDDALARITRDVDCLAAHNAQFDRQFFPDGRLRWICTLKTAVALWPDMPSYGNQALRYRVGLEFDDIAKTLPAHRAGPDSYVTAHLLVRLLNIVDAKGERYPIDAFVKVSAQPKRLLRFTFGKHRGSLLSEVPEDYLDWIVFKSEMDDDVKWNCRRELDRRQA